MRGVKLDSLVALRMYAVSAFANASLNVLKILSHMSAEGLLRLSSTVSLTCFLMFRWEGTRSTAHAKGGNKMTTNLDNDDHLPRLLHPKQVGNRHDVLLKLDKALVVAPVGVGEQDLLRALDKVTLRLRSRLLHHQGKVVALDLETVLDGLAEVFQDGLVEVLEVREEVGREGRVELGDKLEALPRVDARVIPRSGRVKRSCSGKKKSVMHPHVGETRRTESFGAGRLHRRPEVLDDLSGAGRLVEHLDALEEGRKGDSGDLVTTELRKELLLSREVQVLVRDDRVLRRGSTVSAVCWSRTQELTQIVPMYCEIPSAGIRLWYLGRKTKPGSFESTKRLRSCLTSDSKSSGCKSLCGRVTKARSKKVVMTHPSRPSGFERPSQRRLRSASSVA